MRHQVDSAGNTIADLEHALAQLRAAGAPDDAAVRVRASAAFSSDGGHVRVLTARWDQQQHSTQP